MAICHYSTTASGHMVSTSLAVLECGIGSHPLHAVTMIKLMPFRLTEKSMLMKLLLIKGVDIIGLSSFT